MSVKTGALPHTKSQAAVVIAIDAGALSTKLTAKVTGYSQRTCQRVLGILESRTYARMAVERKWRGRTCRIVKLRPHLWMRLVARSRKMLGDPVADLIVAQVRTAGRLGFQT